MLQSRTKWYVVTVVLLGAALLVDRLFFSASGSPATAQADIATGTETDLIAAQSPLPAALKLEVERFPVFSNVFDERESHRDPFQLTQTARKSLFQITPQDIEQGPVASAAKPMTSAEFAQAHHLSAVMEVDGNWSAIVDGVVIGPGHRIGGCQVTDIDARSVTVLCETTSLQLVLRKPLAE